MEYLDSDIIYAKHIKRRDEYGSIEEGMYIKNILTTFKQVLLFEDTLSIMLPDDFVPMLPEMVAAKYRLGNAPAVIYTGLDVSVNISLNLYNNTSSGGDVRLAAGVLKRMLQNTHPSYIFYDDMELKSIDGYEISLFDFKGYALDDATYNIIYMTKTNSHIIQGAFNCMYYDMEEWKRAALEIIKTIKIICK